MSDVADRYERDGFVVVPHTVPAVTVAQWCALLDAVPQPANGLVPVASPFDHEATRSLAQELLSTDVELFGATFVVRPPASPWRVSWHQDGEPWRRQWGIEHAVTVWVALDATGPHNGGLRMIPGSHRLPLRALQPVDDEYDVFGWASAADLVNEQQAVDIVLSAGDVSAHHPATLHASGSNRSSQPRRALSLRYRTTDSIGEG